MSKSMLYATEHKIKVRNSQIEVKIPTVGEILNDESNYYDLVSMITATPTDMMAQLDDVGIDFTEISDWDLFCMLFDKLKDKDVSLILPGLQLDQFEFAQNNQNGEVVLWDSESDLVIDRLIHDEICSFLRQILGFEKNVKKPANKEAKDFLIKRAKVKLKRQLRRLKQEETGLSQLEKFIVSLVCAPEFSYNYESILNLSIYQFNTSLRQVIKRVDFDKLMIGCYAGTISTKGMDKERLTWIMS